MIRLGIVGSNFGRNVLLPAFRTDPRCAVTALAGSDAAKAARLAQESGVARACKTWRELVDDPSIDAVAIAAPPALQPEIAVRALGKGKAVFAEKPLAPGVAEATHMVDAAKASRRPVMVDFEFPELPTWQRAKALLDEGALGALRHVVVTWQVENYATLHRLRSWKTSSEDGGGALGNLVSHCFHYLEYFCGPIESLSARLFGLPGGERPSESIVALTGAFASGAGLSLSMSAASYLGSGHRLEVYGEDGTLTLVNPTADYMRGFELRFARRPATALERIDIAYPEQDRYPDSRIAPIARLAARFLDAIEQGTTPSPGIREGFRVQHLIETARLSHDLGETVTVDDE